MTGLFQDAAAVPPGNVVAVAVNVNLWRTFDYLWPEGLPPPVPGVRVRVPFGRGDRRTLAFVTELNRPAGASGHRLKSVSEVVDAEPQLDDHLRQLGEWISRYYLAPLGMTLAAMVPSAVGRHADQTETVAFLLAEPRDWPKKLGPRQRRILDELHEAAKQGVAPLPLERLLAHSEASRPSVASLADKGLLRLQTRPRTLDSMDQPVEPDPFELNDEQRGVYEALRAGLGGGFGVTLLHGVTGSGKTEVYLRVIRDVIAAGRQAIVLVPEIALATQTLQRLARRLPRVAVLHSGLSGAQRAFYYRQIRQGHAAVVIGPRSAVFAPARKLGLIVVDEEHESSYKQDGVPRYHGRDVAIKRGALENVPVLLGSATPSLESFHNAQQGKYRLLRLEHRIRGLPMPALQLVELRKEITRQRVELIGRTLAERIARALDRRQQVILLMNRRGYASFVFCPSCQWTLHCQHCTRAMVFHQAIALAMCHYCQATAEVPAACPACDKKLLLFGLGIQRIESELARKFPQAVVARMDSDTMTSPAQFREVFDRFAAGEVDMLLGTQMVAKGLDFPRVSLVGVVSADTALAIPDFRASERTFQLIVQVAGRAGRAAGGSEVVVQTWNPSERAIRFALQHDYAGFAAYELPLRAQAGVPPLVRMVRFIIRHRDVERAEAGAAAMGRQLRLWFSRQPDVRIVGPAQAGVFKVKNLFRFEINCYCPRPGFIQAVLADQMPQIAGQVGAEVIADADPMNLL